MCHFYLIRSVDATEKGEKNIPVEQLLPSFTVLNAYSKQKQLF